MISLSAYFLDHERPELDRTEFTHPQVSGSLRAARGHAGRMHGFEGNFHWSSAVQALSILLLETKAWALLAPGEKEALPLPLLAGGKSSPAASLDYAISKQPSWLLDMFGTDSKGTTICRRLLQRSNPERRRPGPVMISVNIKTLPPEALHIFTNEQEVTEPNKLLALAEAIASTWEEPAPTEQQAEEPRTAQNRFHELFVLPGEKQRRGQQWHLPLIEEHLNQRRAEARRPKPFESDEWLHCAKELLKQDITRSLRATDIFSEAGIKRLMSSINNNPSFTRIAGKKPFTPLHFETFRKGLSRLGIAEHESLVRDQLCRPEPINFLSALVPGSSLALYTFLRFVKGYNFCLNCNYRSSIDLVKGIIEGGVIMQPDVIIASPAAAAMLLRSKAAEEFEPLMFMPARLHAVIAPGKLAKGAKRPYQGRYLVCDHGHTDCAFYFESLLRAGLVDAGIEEVEHVGYEEAFSALREGRRDVRISTSLEYFRLIEWFHPFSVLETSRLEMSGMETVLFVHRSLAADGMRTRYLETAIRDAWLDLAEDASALDLALSIVLEDRELLKVMKRRCGLYGKVLDLYEKRPPARPLAVVGE